MSHEKEGLPFFCEPSFLCHYLHCNPAAGTISPGYADGNALTNCFRYFRNIFMRKAGVEFSLSTI